MYKYILWDIDGTVLDFHAAERNAIKTLFEKFNMGECTEEMLRMYSEINAKYWQMLEKGEMTKPEILIGRFRKFFENIGADTSLCEEFNKAYQLALGDTIEFVGNAKEILLSQKGKYIIAAVTNGTRVAQDKKLRLSGLDKIFDEIFISENVGYEKPNKEFFDYVFKTLNIKDKSEVIIIGDSLTGDIKGGYMAGIDACWYNPSRKPNTLGIQITYEIDNIEKVTDIVKL
ncbi:MAG: YjjG family noncanonical pyrimidine nucleotidase [Clostridia bacterium]|nr:YjjG family noncanonical pyrimidine nucleotidase [Clostridia bacterium]